MIDARAVRVSLVCLFRARDEPVSGPPRRTQRTLHLEGPARNRLSAKWPAQHRGGLVGPKLTERPLSDPQHPHPLRDLWETDLVLDDSTELAPALALKRNQPQQCRGAAIPIIETAPARTSIWSNLHLPDRSILLVWNRLFRSIAEMNRYPLARWSGRDGAGDTAICLGDVDHPDTRRDPHLIIAVRDCPGHRLLILGNHDSDSDDLYDT